MAADSDSVAGSDPNSVRSSLRHWAPYVGLAGAAFAMSAGAGVLLGSGGPSAFVPAQTGGESTATLFVGLLSTVALMVIGGVFGGLPTAALLAQQGYEFGGALAALVNAAGVGEAIALAGPPALVGIPALWLAAAIPVRGLHAGARYVRDRPLSSSGQRLALESLLLLVISLLGLGLASVLAGG